MGVLHFSLSMLSLENLMQEMIKSCFRGFTASIKNKFTRLAAKFCILYDFRKTQESWHEEIEIRGQKLWRQELSLPNSKKHYVLKNDEEKS